MTTDELLHELRRLEIGLVAAGHKLRFRAPAGAMTPQVRDDIARHRPEILRRLQVHRAAVLVAGRKCETCNRKHWVDEPLRDGRIRTHCGRCGRFIGYRPAGGK